MATLENGDKNYTSLLTEIENGQIKIPQFQRQFVWSKSNSAKLIDSILKGYPIGTFIYWRTNERLRSIRNIGNIDLVEPKDGEFVNYVLDGQQRITSIFASLKGETVIRENGKSDDFSEIYIDLNATDEDDIVITDITEKEDLTYIKLTELMFEKIRVLSDRFDDEQLDKIDNYKSIINSYQFVGVNLKDAEIDVATEVFTRLNVGGKSLSLFEIMVAKTYSPERGFDLYDEFEKLMKDLKPSYDTISSASVLQLVALLEKRECSRKTILKLDKNLFIDKWYKSVDAIKQSVDFFKSFGIPVSKLLPYNSLIVPFGYFFYHHPTNPSGKKLSLLIDFFWRVSLGYRYSSAVEGKLVQDIDKMDKILSESQPKYEWKIDYSVEGIKEQGEFSTGKSFIKAILCLLTMQKPKSFHNNLDVNVNNDWLKITTSKNYHHFFPKSFMRKNYKDIDPNLVNHVVNITIVDDHLNKNIIRAKSPSEYMLLFKEQNQNLVSTMKTHLIDELDSFGIWDNDYMTFFSKRLKLISDKIGEQVLD